MKDRGDFRRRLKHGDKVIGCWQVIPSAGVAEVIANAGFDFIIVDMEHGPATIETLEQIVRAVENTGKTPLVRVPSLDESMILRVLETGVHGIIVPQIASAAEAEAVVQAVKYHPRGHRGLSPYTRSGGYVPTDTRSYTQQANDDTTVILLVEGRKGLANLDAIAAVPDVDVIYLGIYDLSQAAGHPGEITHPEVVELVRDNFARIRQAGVAAGCLASNSEDMKRYIQSGVQFLAYEADCALLGRAVNKTATEFRSIASSNDGKGAK